MNANETLRHRIKEERLKRNITLKEVAEYIGVKEATAQRYESGDIKTVPYENVVLIAEILKTTPNYLMGWQKDDNEDFPLPSNLKPIKQIHRVPILGRIACGNPILAEENYEGYTYLPDDVRADFALKCKGDSMIEANIFDGDMVFIRIQPTVENGEIAAVLIDDEATLKRINFDGTTLVLYPANSTLSPTYYTGEELENVRIVGKMQALLRMCSK